MRRSSWMILIGVLALCGNADAVFAWGPATHVGLAGSVLEQLGLLPTAIAALLARHRIAFVYGNIAADMVFAKRLSRVKQFCHHWSTGFRLLEAARGEEDRAFAYGYLSHLAADTVAHGKFVPRQIVLSGSTVNLGHLYWELRADSLQPETSWVSLRSVIQWNHAAHHSLMATQLQDTFLPFHLNRICFDRMNAVASHPCFRGAVAQCARLSPVSLSCSLVDGYRGESIDRTVDVLTNGHRSTLLREDPNGTSALMQVHVRRRHLRRLRRAGTPIGSHLRETRMGWAPGEPACRIRNESGDQHD